MHNNYRLLDVLLYNTGIYLGEYTASKVILDEPLVESNMTFQAVYESKYIPVLYSKTSYNLFILHLINEAWLFKRLKTFPYIFLIVRSNKSFTFLLLDVVFFHSDIFTVNGFYR